MKFNRLIILIVVFCSSLTILAQSTDSFLPHPGGIYQVGTTQLFLEDSSRKDPFKHRDFRKVYVKIWYPALVKDSDQVEKYLEDYPLSVVHQTFKIKDFDKEWIAKLKQMPTHSFKNAAIASAEKNYPVLIFNPGFYFGLADLYVNMMEEMASHGFIVCSINHPYEQPYIPFEDEELYLKKKRAQWAYLQLVVADFFQFKARDSHEQIAEITRYYHKMLHRFQKTVALWSQDSRFVLDYLEEVQKDGESPIIQKMNLNRVGAFGQSLGGSVSGHLCTIDERVNAGVNMDCFQFGNPIDQPIEQAFMLIQSDYSDSWNLGNTINYENTLGDFSFLSFPGSSHFVFSDAAILPYDSKEIEKSMIGDVDGAMVLRNLNNYLLDFFNYYLNDAEPVFILNNGQLSNLIYNFREGIQYKKTSGSASKN